MRVNGIKIQWNYSYVSYNNWPLISLFFKLFILFIYFSGLLEKICDILHTNDIVTYIAFLDWRENWSKGPVLEVKGRAEAHITLANFFMKLFWNSIKPSTKYKSIVKELNSFDLEHFVSMSKLPPEIGKRKLVSIGYNY